MKLIEHASMQDTPMTRVAASLPQDAPVKITISGVAGVWIDEAAYDGLLETIKILQENPAIVQSLKERELGEFIDEEELINYV